MKQGGCSSITEPWHASGYREPLVGHGVLPVSGREGFVRGALRIFQHAPAPVHLAAPECDSKRQLSYSVRQLCTGLRSSARGTSGIERPRSSPSHKSQCLCQGGYSFALEAATRLHQPAMHRAALQ